MSIDTIFLGVNSTGRITNFTQRMIRMKTGKTRGALLVAGLFCALASTSAIAQSSGESVLFSSNSAVSGATGGRIIQLGEKSGDLVPLKGFAKGLPLLSVLKQITPPGWVVKKNDTPANRLDIQKMVSWDGGKNWVETLSDLSNSYAFNGIVNWEKKEIIIAPMEKSSTGSIAIDKTSSIFEMGSSDTGTIKAEPIKAVSVSGEAMVPVKVAPIKVVPSWNMDKAKTLKENVTDWATKAGFKVVWNGDDYPVETRVMSGEFDDDNGPIYQISQDYGVSSSVLQPLSFIFFKNKTLVVNNVGFEQKQNSR